MKKIFNFFSIEKNGENFISLRQFLKFSKFLEFNENIPDFDQANIDLIFFHICKNKMANFKEFIEILYKINKIIPIKKKKDKYDLFKIFIDKYLLTVFKKKTKFINYIEKIQIFHLNYKSYQNPTIDLFYECNEFLKHVIKIFNFLN